MMVWFGSKISRFLNPSHLIELRIEYKRPMMAVQTYLHLA